MPWKECSPMDLRRGVCGNAPQVEGATAASLKSWRFGISRKTGVQMDAAVQKLRAMEALERQVATAASFAGDPWPKPFRRR